MGLRDYQRKRDFGRTPEPAGRPPRKGGKDRGRNRGKNRFVVQKHDATRLHYDFRLELDGVLKSWAVPKGPSLDPRERRLAVQVEDHPVEYGGFEGVIPEGEYGGGTVMLWDRGRWHPNGDPGDGLRQGRLKFRLDGEKLGGAFSLVRMRAREPEDGSNWLLIKEKDEAAKPLAAGDVLEERPESVASGRDLAEIARDADRVWTSSSGEVRAGRGRKGAAKAAKAPKGKPDAKPGKRRAASARVRPPKGAPRARLPAEAEAQLATLVEAPPTGPGWIHELKLDGYRVLARIEGGAVRLSTRRGNDWTRRFARVAAALAELAHDALLDGEVVALDDGGRTSFHALQRALSEGRDRELTYFAFDLLHLDGRDLSALPLSVRKRLLAGLVAELASPAVRYGDHVEGHGAEFFRRACEARVEGVVSKRAAARYRPGRGSDWVKSKCLSRQEFVIGGFTDPSGSREGLGALLVGVYEGKRLRYAGKVGTGFDADTLNDLRRRLERLERKRPPFVDPPSGAEARGAHWVSPKLVAEIAFVEWTAEGLLRHASFQGLREDKPAPEVRNERPQPPPGDGGRAGPEGGASVAGVRLSNPERVLYPEQGLTKLDLARYYEAVAASILPHLQGRPLTLVRCPRGREGNCFYQKHVVEGLPEELRTVDVREVGGKAEPYVYVVDLPGLVALVQMGVLELHGWGALAEDVEKPDRLVFDIDPDPDLPWKEVAATARKLRDRLAELGLESWVTTTGGKGLHVVAPLARRQGWGVVKGAARAVAEGLVREEPERYVSKAAKAARHGKIFIDWLRNARGATAIMPFSTRARPDAPVATPLSWSEVGTVKPAERTVASTPRRLAARRSDPWEGFFESRQSLSRKALAALGVEG